MRWLEVALVFVKKESKKGKNKQIKENGLTLVRSQHERHNKALSKIIHYPTNQEILIQPI